MPRTPRIPGRASNGRSRSSARAQPVISQITQIVVANEQLERENRELRAENERLRAQLTDIGGALGRLTGGPGRGRGSRGGGEASPEPAPRRPRRSITDPEVLAKRAQALTKARAARAEKLAAARAASRAAEPDGAQAGDAAQ